MPNTRKNNKKIWKGSGGPYDTDNTKSSTGDSSRSSTPSVFSKFLKHSSSDRPLNPPSRSQPNSEHNISADNKRQIIDQYDEANKGQKPNTYPLQTALDQNRQRYDSTEPIAFGPYQYNDKETFEPFGDIPPHPNTHYYMSSQLPQNKPGGKSRRKSKKSKKRTRKTKRKSRR